MDAYVCIVSGALQFLLRLVRECSDLRPFVLFVCVDLLPPNQHFLSCLDKFLSSTNAIYKLIKCLAP